jgi:hypothetical protein
VHAHQCRECLLCCQLCACVCVYVYMSHVKGWKPDKLLSKGMGRVRLRVFGTAVEEGSKIGCVGTWPHTRRQTRNDTNKHRLTDTCDMTTPPVVYEANYPNLPAI